MLQSSSVRQASLCYRHRNLRSKFFTSAYEKVATTILNPSIPVDFSFWSNAFDDKCPVLIKGTTTILELTSY